MIKESEFKSTGDLSRAIKESVGRGEKRDYKKDAEEFLRLEGTEWKVQYRQVDIPPIPTIFAANHYSRVPILRAGDSFMTTNDSLRSTGIITIEATKLNPLKMTWTAKGKLPRLLFFLSGLRETQEAAIFAYDLIDVDAPPRETYRDMQAAAEEGLNLGIYPTGKVGRVLRRPRKGSIPGFRKPQELIGFRAAIRQYYETGSPFQIVPVTVFQQENVYQAVFNEVVSPKDGLDRRQMREDVVRMEQETMIKIARELPPNLRGDYKNLV